MRCTPATNHPANDTQTIHAPANSRDEQSLTGRLCYWFAVALALAHLYANTLGTLPELWVSALHFGGFALLCALGTPTRRQGPAATEKALLVLDYGLGLTALICAGYLIGFEDALYERGVSFTTTDWVFALAAIGVALELTRRTTGWFIPLMTLTALTYVFWWGQYLDGVFGFPGLSLETLLFRSYFSAEGMFGPIARISWTFVFMFILFGAFLLKSGAGEFIIELSRCAAGRFVGGPGFVAVLASGLMGSVSGSSVANTASTGVITIPLMRKAGFPPKFAAGVEAAASTGGQLMPPVMGAGAFIMASYTQLPYVDIIAIAALPALLYFLSVGFFVRVEAMRSHAHAIELDTRPVGEVLKEGWHSLLPLFILVALLLYGFTPTYAAGLSILSVIVASWFSRTPMKLKEICDALALGSKNMAATAILLVTVGLVVNVVAMTGIGNTFSLMITDWAGGSLLLTLLLVAVASLILGMGLPVTASYIVPGDTLGAGALRPDCRVGAGAAHQSGQVAGNRQGHIPFGGPRKGCLAQRAHERGRRQATACPGAGRLQGTTVGDGAVTGHPGYGAAVGPHDHLLALPGQQRHPAGLSDRLCGRRHRQNPADGHRLYRLESRQGALHHSRAFCLYRSDWRHHGRSADRLWLRPIRDLRADRRHGRLPGGSVDLDNAPALHRCGAGAVVATQVRLGAGSGGSHRCIADHLQPAATTDTILAIHQSEALASGIAWRI